MSSNGRVALRVEELCVHYHTERGAVRAVEGIDFELRAGERLGLVGESGSGKSTTAMALMRLIRPPGRIEAGRIHLGELELLTLSEEEMRRVRFARISLIPQGVMNSLNPVMRVGAQIADTIEAHEERPTREELEERVSSLLTLVELEPDTARMHPHELSGGMKQRVGMAIAVALRPEVIIADEPTSALDVVVQKRVMDTLFNVQQELGAAVILVGHDMGLMAQCVDRIGVMYAGRLVEVGPVQRLFEAPLHPYTRMLVASLPSLERKGDFRGIPGLPPSLIDPFPGCPFHPRCPEEMDCCASEVPHLDVVAEVLADTGGGDAASERRAACHLHSGDRS
ncbi:MAG: ABC transporter ATP-binding protein [Candidatus Latescibacterota bacterium]|nr:ABC transporter ATP-binding protein [Candidatus Latescibacterota bacterium]